MWYVVGIYLAICILLGVAYTMWPSRCWHRTSALPLSPFPPWAVWRPRYSATIPLKVELHRSRNVADALVNVLSIARFRLIDRQAGCLTFVRSPSWRGRKANRLGLIVRVELLTTGEASLDIEFEQFRFWIRQPVIFDTGNRCWSTAWDVVELLAIIDDTPDFILDLQDKIRSRAATPVRVATDPTNPYRSPESC